MKKVKFAIVGYGNIGKRHAHHILQNTRAELVAVASLEPKPSELQCNYYHSLAELLVNEKIDVLNVCTPNYLHGEHSIAALSQGINVVCEKPMATNTTTCNQMIAAAEKANRKLFVVKQNRHNPPVAAVKTLLENGTLGKPYLITINCFWNRNEAYYAQSSWRGKKMEDGGCLYTQFSHFVDILYYLFGDVNVISGKIKNFNHPYIETEDSGMFLLETKEGALVNFNFSTSSYARNMEGAIAILAENGTVKIGGQYLNTIEYQKIKNHEIPEINISAKANDYGLYQGSMSNHDLMIQNVIDHLDGKAAMMTNALEGRNVVAIIEKMYAAAQVS